MFLKKRRAPECPENSEDFFAEDQRVPGEAVNALTAYPLEMRRQFRIQNCVFDVYIKRGASHSRIAGPQGTRWFLLAIHRERQQHVPRGSSRGDVA